MSGSLRPEVKVCCICSAAETAAALRLGADALGFVSAMPSGPGVIPESQIAELVALVPSRVATFLLTSERDPSRIVAQARRTGVTTVQLCDSLKAPSYTLLRARLPGVRLVQVIHVTGWESIEEARLAGPHVDGLLLDSGRPDAPIRELGGTGRTHDWRISARLREEISLPVYLAGGLCPENVAEAIRQVRPYGVDVCTGVRTGDRLDEEKLTRFIRAVRTAG